MTMILTTGKTLNRQMRDMQAETAYVTKIATNVAPKLNRIGAYAVATIARRPKNEQNRMKIVVRDDDNEINKVAKVLEVSADQIHAGSTMLVKFGRINVMVTFRKDRATVNETHNARKTRKAA